MTENYKEAKRKSLAYLEESRRNIKRLKQLYNRSRNQRNYMATQRLKREIQEKQKDFKFRKQLFEKTFKD